MQKLALAARKALGKKVVATANFAPGEVIIEFSGPAVLANEIPKLIRPEDDRFLQVGKGLYMGASGRFDDFFNHSCRPNAGLVEKNGLHLLTAISKICPGDEIVWDYSTYMDEYDWEMNCLCGEKNCRGRIRDFRFLPPGLRKRYLKLGIVPKFIASKYQ